MNTAPVGIFDSGLGGLSVALEVRSLLPSERIIHLADTAWCPYGGRPLEEIRARSIAAVSALVGKGVKAVVVACNTASGAALETLRAEFSLPIVGMEPAVKPAAEATRAGRIGVLATQATLRTERFARLCRTYAQDLEVVLQPGTGLVELVEEAHVRGEDAQHVLEALLAPVRDAGVDVLVLGCTHYPFLRDEIAAVMGPDVRIIDSGRAVAKQLERVLRERDLLAPERTGSFRLLTSGDPRHVTEVAERLLGESVDVEGVGDLFELAQRVPSYQESSSGAARSAGSRT
ncbi:MAG TPA: glutamate racemase [Longimicrobiaceae bacterium]|nr:glutamate racemase [Longimicrobiaceae bacterium]